MALAAPRPDGSVEAALAIVAPNGKGSMVLLTFGDSKVQRVLENFVAHATTAGAPHIVGAVDTGTYDRLSSVGVAVYKTPLALQADYKMDGSNTHGSQSWQRFAAMRTGEVARIVTLGYDVLHTDVDVVWLRSPLPYLRCSVNDAKSEAASVSGARENYAVESQIRQAAVTQALRCESLRSADVAVSSDNMSPGDDAHQGVGYAIGGTLNTGLLFIRATAAGTRFANAWHEIVVSPPPGRKFAGPGCCTSDQQVFGRMIRDEGRPYPGLAVPPGRARVLPAWNGKLVAPFEGLAPHIHRVLSHWMYQNLPPHLLPGSSDLKVQAGWQVVRVN